MSDREYESLELPGLLEVGVKAGFLKPRGYLPIGRVMPYYGVGLVESAFMDSSSLVLCSGAGSRTLGNVGTGLAKVMEGEMDEATKKRALGLIDRIAEDYRQRQEPEFKRGDVVRDESGSYGVVTKRYIDNLVFVRFATESVAWTSTVEAETLCYVTDEQIQAMDPMLVGQILKLVKEIGIEGEPVKTVTKKEEAMFKEGDIVKFKGTDTIGVFVGGTDSVFWGSEEAPSYTSCASIVKLDLSALTTEEGRRVTELQRERDMLGVHVIFSEKREETMSEIKLFTKSEFNSAYAKAQESKPGYAFVRFMLSKHQLEGWKADSIPSGTIGGVFPRYDSWAEIQDDEIGVKLYGKDEVVVWKRPEITEKKQPFKVGDRVVHKVEGPGEIIGIRNDAVHIKLDSGKKGLGFKGSWVTYTDKLTYAPEEQLVFKRGDIVGHIPNNEIGVFVGYWCDQLEHCKVLFKGYREPGRCRAVNLMAVPPGVVDPDDFRHELRRVTAMASVELTPAPEGGRSFKVGDRVLHNREGTGKVTGFFEGNLLEVKLDSGKEGSGSKGTWVATASELTPALEESIEKVKIPKYGNFVISANNEPYECSVCKQSLQGCSVCTQESISERIVRIEFKNIFGEVRFDNLMRKINNIWIPAFTSVAKFKLDDTVIETPKPEGANWAISAGYDKLSKFFVTEVRDDGLIRTTNPGGLNLFIWLGHQEGLVWLHDMGRVLVENQAQFLSSEIWKYTPLVVEVEEPYDYHCASKNELKGSWPTSRRP